MQDQEIIEKPKRQTAADRRAKAAAGISDMQLRYTPAQAQVLLAFGNTKFWAEVGAGHLKVYRDGARTFVDREELERYAAARRAA
jgi:hypothetical protein